MGEFRVVGVLGSLTSTTIIGRVEKWELILTDVKFSLGVNLNSTLLEFFGYFGVWDVAASNVES